MALVFEELIKSFLPKGKAWDIQKNSNIDKLVGGTSKEFSRVYTDASNFYDDFNIINSSNLASKHGKDYLIKTEIFTKKEIQKIVVDYLNKDFTYKDILNDFALFIGESITFGKLPTSLEFGDAIFGDEFGDPSLGRTMEVLIILSTTISCQNFTKIKWLSDYLKPPYINVLFENKPINSITQFSPGYSQFGDELGELSTC